MQLVSLPGSSFPSSLAPPEIGYQTPIFHVFEPNITEVVGKKGAFSYRVQICKHMDGKQHSLTQTFRNLINAKRWRNQKLLDIEVNGLPAQIVTETTVSDINKNRLKHGKTLGRSGLQLQNYIKDDEFGKTKVSTLTQHELFQYADLLSASKRTRQTVAG